MLEASMSGSQSTKVAVQGNEKNKANNSRHLSSNAEGCQYKMLGEMCPRGATDYGRTRICQGWKRWQVDTLLLETSEYIDHPAGLRPSPGTSGSWLLVSFHSSCFSSPGIYR